MYSFVVFGRYDGIWVSAHRGQFGEESRTPGVIGTQRKQVST